MSRENQLVNLMELFSSERLFRVPDYQRGYSWQAKQLLDFWNDILNLREGKNHYTGLLTLKKIDNENEINKILSENDKWLRKNKFSAYHIVDGQQRLTTAIIFINELVKFFKSKKISAVRDGVESLDSIIQKYICRTNKNGATAYIFGYSKDSSDYDCLKYSIFKYENTVSNFGKELTIYAKNLIAAQKFFSKKLKTLSINDAEEIYKKLVMNLKFNVYEIDDEIEVYVAFETMNNRGKTLSALELLKNRLIYLTTLLNGDTENLREEIKAAWREIYLWLGKQNSIQLSDDDFLRTHWIIYYRKNERGSNVDAAKNFLLDKFAVKKIPSWTINEIQSYTQSLKKYVKYYYFTYFPEDNNPSNNFNSDEKIMVKRLNRLDIKFFRPLIMVAASFENNDKRLNLFKAIERFIFVNFCLGGRKPDTGDTTYYCIAKELNFGIANFDSIIEKLSDDVESDMENSIDKFVEIIEDCFRKDSGYYTWKALKYFLYEYEYYLSQKNYGAIALNFEKTSVEHILPQNINSQDLFADFSWSDNFAKYNEPEMLYLTGALGNLLLLPQSTNSSYQNDSFKNKVDPPHGKSAGGYRQGSHSEREVVKISEAGSGDWTAKEIKHRSEIMLNFMIEHWNLKISAEQMQKLIQLDFV